MSSGSTKVFIQVESESEQQGHAKCPRKKLTVLQKTADKENLIGRQNVTSGKEKVLLSKSDSKDSTAELKRKKISVTSTSSQTEPQHISADDLTTDDTPSEFYWEMVAEKRRLALDDTLQENQRLHEKVETLEEELDTSRKLVEESRNLIEVLTEMLKDAEGENEENENDETDEFVEDEESQL